MVRNGRCRATLCCTAVQLYSSTAALGGGLSCLIVAQLRLRYDALPPSFGSVALWYPYPDRREIGRTTRIWWGE